MDIGSAVRTLHDGLFVSHEYVMLANAVLSTYILLRWFRNAFDFTYAVLPHHIVILLNCTLLPGFYFLEALPMMLYCSENDLNYCKFGIHHLFTVMLFLVVITFELYSGPAMGIQATHGFMNFFSYHHLLTMYLFCQWYLVFTILCAVHIIYQVILGRLLPGIPKIILWLQILGLFLVGANNYFSSDLVSSCVRPEDTDSLLANAYVWSFHISMGLTLIVAFWKYTKEGNIVKQ
jgi:hypothetical protein